MNTEIREACFPLSLSQLNILNLERVLVGTSVNNISTTLRITGRIDFPLLQKSIRLVLESDASLRTRLVEEDGEVLQYHAPYVREEYPVYDFSNTGAEGMENWERAVSRELIPLFDGPLYRFLLFRDAENSGGILVKLHHIISDGWSQVMLCNKISQTYLQLLSGEEAVLEETPDYQLHVDEEQEYLSSRAFAKDEAYWRQIVENMGDPSVLKSVSSAAVSYVGRRKSFDLPEILNHAIYSYCMEKRVAPFAVFYMALAIYFKRNGGADKFTIGVPIFNRTNFAFKKSTGMFVTTLPFYNEIDDAWTLDDFNDVLTDRWLELLRHQRYPFSKITELAGNDGRLFHIALSYQDSKLYENHDTSIEFSGRWHYAGYQAEQLTIHLTNLKDHRRYAVDYGYLTQFFSEDEIVSLHESICHVLSEMLNESDGPIHRLNILSLEQKEQLLYTFNRTDRYVKERSVYRALIENNARYINRAAVIRNGERMTYGALLHRGAQFAAALRQTDLQTEGLVAVLLPRCEDLLCAMVGVLQAGGAYMLLSESLPTERINTILAQSNASALITNRNGKNRLSDCDLPLICTQELDVFSLSAYPAVYGEESDSSNAGDRLAYVVYTSGSTGEPKGVEITQRSLLNLASEMETVYGQGAILSVCNVGFDAFMLESIAALLNGKTIVLPDERELESPERLAALVNGYAVGFLSVTPSRLSAFLQNDAFRGVMWRMESIICGGEHFPPELLKKLKMCTAARIYNQYGPSETTVAVSMKDLSHADRITAGKPMGNCKLYVLDQWMNPLPIGGNGRLFVGGKCVGRGYRNRPDLTEKVFRNNPFVSDDRLYDTGDLAYWTPDGEIVLTGRADRQVKLRGLRIELQEIASCIESYPGIDAAYARICEFGGQQVIGAYYSAGCDLNEMELLSHVATYLPEYMIPTFVMRVSGFAITANGKIDEKKLPMPQKTADTACTDISATAERITEIFREVLSQEDIYANSDYFLCGGNSLNALTCIIKIEEAFSQKIRISDLYACRTANRLAELIDSSSPSYHKKQASGPSVPASYLMKKAPACAEYPLSPMQEGIYVQSMLDPNGLSYNMPGAFLLETAPDRLRLRGAFERLIAEDAIFRTSFSFGENGICARVSEKVEFVLEELNADTFEDACKAFLRPFDLTRAPLLRAALWTSGEGASYLLIDSHHIIGDGMSTPIVLQRLDRAYSGKDLFVEWDYYDYLHTAAQENGDEKKRSLDYWTSHLQDLPEPLVIPTDKVPPKTFDYKGDDLALTLTEEQSRICEQFCRENGYSEYVLFLAAWGLLLSAASGNKDMIIGTPVAGRKYFGSTDVCGPFINTLPLRLTPSRELTVTQWLKRVQNEVSQMLDHQDVSLEEIITALDLPRGGQNALYRVMLTQSPVDESGFMLDGKKMVFRGIPTGSVKMDMILELAKKDACYVLRFSYAASLFERQTVAFYGRCIVQIVKELTQNGDRAVSELALLCAADKETYIDIPNFSATPFVNRPVHQILKHRSAMDGDATAVIYHGEEISFARLERRAMAIAHFLEEHGVRPGQCVGLCLRRTPDMIAAMYGILKAGCAYMFMLESFPLSRKTYMLEISNAAILLCDTASDPLLQEKLPCETYPLPVGACDSYDDRLVSDGDLVNVLFTSGSTGRPKGVMLSHRSVSNLCAQMKTLLDPIPGRVLCSTNAVFDCFVVETMIALALGRTVVLADEEEMMLPWKLAQLVETYRTGIFEMTPSRLQMCLGNEAFCHAAKHIRIVLLGGEVVTETLRDKFYAHSDGMLMNMYGPTEATVFTTMAHLKTGEHITIGAPLQNTRVYVLDEDRKPVLPTAYGEIYIAGECLSCGYISRPELTEQSFFDDIYFPGQKMYRSGDLARLRMDGRYDYLGRKDAQVKLNGQRVELTEITGAIDHVDGIVQSAIVPVKKEDGSMTLHVFYTTDMDVTSERIIAEISRVLPEYMVPSVYTVLKHMPVTATNKIDMQTLRAMATDQKTVNPEEHTASALAQTEVPCAPAEAAHTVADPLGTEAAVEDASIASAPCHRETDSVPAAENTAEAAEETSVRPVRSGVVLNTEYILSVWNSVLPMPAKDPTESFFKQGGTSMSALNVLSRFYNDGFEMTLTDFYTNPTAEMQVSLLGRSRAVMAVTDNASETDTEPTQTAEEEHACSILVTGATGFLGVHIVKELLDGGAKKVACLVRDGSRERLDSILTYYFGDEDAARLSARIEIVCGNITQKMLGLSSDDYRRLVGSIKEIYHCAADVRHYAADEAAFLSTNVDGTENMLTLARRADAQFYHMSTCSVSGDNLRKGNVEAIFTERDYDIGQIWERNIYVKSKFLAEGLVFEAIKEGLRAKIFRVGRLVGRASDGKFQRNPETNAFYLFIKGILSVGAIPCDAAQINIDLMPVDLCAMEIVALAHSSGTVYHMENAIPATLGEILNTVDDGGILAVSREAFIEMFRKNCRSMDNDLLVMVMNNWRIMELRKPKIVVTNDMTIAALKEAGFVYPDVSIKTILREFEKGE